MQNPERLLTTLLLLLASSFTQALQDDWQQEMIIQSNSAELDRKSGMVVYEGKVQLTQGTLKIEADRLVLMFEGKHLQQAIANGNPANYEQKVSKDKPVTRASAERIDYFATSREVAFTGNAELRQDSNLFSGEVIRYNINTETVTARGAESTTPGKQEEPKQRIRVVIQPDDAGPAE
ncbi:lipopolysaccharide transport periplasmic protein LptA [Parathalassolituus penaei]|uniref:Lipopolysaccharide export system protein LptA n=1 Tax=Parathalassolituus penaei TaxID=2997323 RepID=A0A9X3EDD8_9GAMM|nr:lipopolysaccharide transport periplasmic protein LptA [Parathalassolituus penaei]MCY0965552.1 lipopolysaccharide transport periplasmic protein LptA [Parathalassolituus penaei]